MSDRRAPHLQPKPEPTIDPVGGQVTFPQAHGRVIRDHGFVPVVQEHVCPGGCGELLRPGMMAVMFMVMPERLLIVGCWRCTFAFAADRGAAKRAGLGMPDAGLLVTAAPSSA